MRLYFLRHGEAVSDGSFQDSDRPLTEHGIAQGWAVGSLLSKAGIEPEMIFSSPLVRAKQTAEIIREALHLEDDVQVMEFLDPMADQRHLFTELSSYHMSTFLLVGHQPFIADAVSLLIAGSRRVRLQVGQATLIGVEIDDVQRPGTGRLEVLLPHRLLEATQG